jgi:tetratricopeptide (TPR) repeat protein
MLHAGLSKDVDPEQLLQIADAARTTFPEESIWLERRAQAYLMLSQPALALKDWEQLAVISPTNALAWFNIGLIQRGNGDLQQAESSFVQALGFDKQNHIEYYIVLAETYEALQMPAQAIATYKQALAIMPDHIGIQQALARLGG